jgi:hypothetical protein
MVESGLWHLSRKQATRKGSWVQILLSPPDMESNAAALVRRRALKTRFSEMGWGSTPLLSATFRMRPAIFQIQLVIEK